MAFCKMKLVEVLRVLDESNIRLVDSYSGKVMFENKTDKVPWDLADREVYQMYVYNNILRVEIIWE